MSPPKTQGHALASKVSAWFTFTLRDNPAGEIREHWYHAQGCRNWIVVMRDSRDHSIRASILLKAAAP